MPAVRSAWRFFLFELRQYAISEIDELEETPGFKRAINSRFLEIPLRWDLFCCVNNSIFPSRNIEAEALQGSLINTWHTNLHINDISKIPRIFLIIFRIIKTVRSY